MGFSKGMAALLLVVLVSCTAKDGDGEQGPSGLEPGGSCRTTGDCRQGLVCDDRRKTCICTSNEACGAGSFCHPITGLCVRERPGCRIDEDCGPDRSCDVGRGVCVDARGFCEPCERDGQCSGRQSRCLKDLPTDDAGFCGMPCAVDGDCPTSRSRCERGQCRPALRCYEISGKETGRCVDPCGGDEDCPVAGDRCELGLCRQPIGCGDLVPCVADTSWPCKKNSDCTMGQDQVCEVGRCVARRSGCDHAEVCDPVSLACVPGCSSHDECRSGRICQGGICRPKESCQRHTDCAAGKVCVCPEGTNCSSLGASGACVPACASSDDCPIGAVCLDERGKKVCRPGCGTDRDCGPEQACDVSSGRCLDSCRITELCRTCQVCKGGRCTPASSPDRPYCGACAGEGVDSSCGPGGVCWAGRCAPSCESEGCPSGFGCMPFDAGEDGVLHVCLPLDGKCDTECT